MTMKQSEWAWILPGVGVVDVCLALKPGIMGSMPIIGTEMIIAGTLLPISDDFDGWFSGKHGERASNEAREKGDRNG